MSNEYNFVIVIKNIKDPNGFVGGGTSNKYKGAYKKIFDILDEDSIFVQSEVEDEILKGNDFYLYFNSFPDADKLQRISKIPNVEILNKNFEKGGLIAPNGKPSNLNATQYELVRTPAFKKWFGDWENDPANASKVVDENGEPLVVYHGTYVENPFYVFDFEKADLGFHFGTFEQAKNRSETKLFFKGRKSIVNSFFLNIKKLFEISDAGQFEYPQRYIDELVNNNFISEETAKKYGFYNAYYREDNKKIRDYLVKKYNNIGFVYENQHEGIGNSYIVLESNQIKLADGTNTTFDSGSDDIRFAKGGKTKGDCYLVAGQLALEIKNKDIDYKGTPYLVHAEVKHSAIEGLRYGHAFIEDDENVYDFSNNREIIMPKQLYYYFGDINPRDKKKYRKYTFKEAKEKMLSTGHYGCWDIEVDYEKGGRVFNDKELLEKWKKGESIGFTGIAHLKSKGLIPRADGVKRKSEKYMEKGGEIDNFIDFYDELKIEDGSKYIGQKFGSVFPFLGKKRRVPNDYRIMVKQYNGVLSRLEENNYSSKSIKQKDLNKLERIKNNIDKKEFLGKFYLDNTGTIVDFEKNEFANGGLTIAQTPAPKQDQIKGSDINKKSSSKNLSSAKLIKFDDKTLDAIKNKVKEHNAEHPDKKINLSSAKAVVRRGFGAYSSSHRPTISGGKPNSRVAWGLARLNAFTYKIINGKSKSGKYSQDDDLIEELGYKVANYENGGKMKDIRCINCGWEWNRKDSELWDMYVCHKCGFDNTSFYSSDPINRLLKGGGLNSSKGVTPNYLKMFLGK